MCPRSVLPNSLHLLGNNDQRLRCHRPSKDPAVCGLGYGAVTQELSCELQEQQHISVKLHKAEAQPMAFPLPYTSSPLALWLCCPLFHVNTLTVLVWPKTTPPCSMQPRRPQGWTPMALNTNGHPRRCQRHIAQHTNHTALLSSHPCTAALILAALLFSHTPIWHVLQWLLSHRGHFPFYLHR